MTPRVHDQKLTMELEVWPFHLDLRGQYPLSQVVARMIHVAGVHASHFGYGIDHLMQHGSSWVLSRMSIRFEEPVEVKPLYITTGVTDWSGISTDRTILLQQGEELRAVSNTKWIAIDIDKRMPLPIDRILNDTAVRATFDNVELPEIPRRLIDRQLADRLQSVYTHTVRYTDLDINCHVNTSVWVSLAMDALPLEHILQRKMYEAHMRFAHEAKLGQHLDVKCHSDGLTDYIQIEESESICFQLMIKWKVE
ncbi:MAG: thioesterase [Porphyromonas sp.]|nr:thioesterase [Porphyromonas sp.]